MQDRKFEAGRIRSFYLADAARWFFQTTFLRSILLSFIYIYCSRSSTPEVLSPSADFKSVMKSAVVRDPLRGQFDDFDKKLTILQ